MSHLNLKTVLLALIFVGLCFWTWSLNRAEFAALFAQPSASQRARDEAIDRAAADAQRVEDEFFAKMKARTADEWRSEFARLIVPATGVSPTVFAQAPLKFEVRSIDFAGSTDERGFVGFRCSHQIVKPGVLNIMGVSLRFVRGQPTEANVSYVPAMDTELGYKAIKEMKLDSGVEKVDRERAFQNSFVSFKLKDDGTPMQIFSDDIRAKIGRGICAQMTDDEQKSLLISIMAESKSITGAEFRMPESVRESSDGVWEFSEGARRGYCSYSYNCAYTRKTGKTICTGTGLGAC